MAKTKRPRFSVVERRTLQKKGLKTLFENGHETASSGEHCLLLEIGQDYCQYAFWRPSTNTIEALKFISFTEMESAESAPEIIKALTGDFQSVIISIALPQALLIPTKFFNNNYTALDAIYYQPAQAYKHDVIEEWQMVTIYSMPKTLQQLLDATFPSAQYVHAYTSWIKIYSGYVADNQLGVHFTPQHFRVLLKKDSMIHLAQTYAYQTPLDVIYHLLKICYEFELEQSSVHLILSGLIAQESNLYTDLQQYFSNLHFAQPSTTKLPAGSPPQHFFTSLNNLATCASSVEV